MVFIYFDLGLDVDSSYKMDSHFDWRIFHCLQLLLWIVHIWFYLFYFGNIS